MAGQ
ncbi:hypothetical protein D021_4225A, partial [Vibrio parahaemolyticus 10296]|jgi:hypothetical protein